MYGIWWDEERGCENELREVDRDLKDLDLDM